MGWIAQILFRIGYFPIIHQSVKQDFLSWYYRAARNQQVVDGLQMDNSELSEMAQTAAQHAENLDEEHPTIQIFDIVDEYCERAQKMFYWIFMSALVLGVGVAGTGIFTWDDLLFRALTFFGGASAALFAAGIMGLYHILEHYLRTSASLVRKFNEELTEKPGDVRRNDREWPKLAAQFFWNKSLCYPKTIMVLVLLSVIRSVNTRLYGRISGDIHHSVDDFVGMEGKEILRHQFERLKEGDVFEAIEPYSPPPEPLQDHE